ncbi:hypothetical protein DRN74_03015 [Candidatus Micrarchaeota archaeon]|nr:MAG: hypothetical protein DRN74_03015 [Candidatus Micrarchaeota archaeon]
MRIGFFSDTYFPETNGVVMSINIFGGELVRRGHEVHVICPKSDRTEERGMKIHSRNGIPFLPYPGYIIAFPWGPVPDLDIVHAHGPFTMGIHAVHTAHKQKIPLVATFHTMLPDYVHYIAPYGKRIMSRVAEAYCYWHYSYYDKVIVPSHVIKRKVSAWIKNEIEVIPTGTDTKLFRPIRKSIARKKMKLEAYDKIYLYLGRIGMEKNIDVLLKAARKFLKKNDILVIAGKGPWEAEMHRLIKRLGIEKHVRYLGFLERDMVPYCYAAADVFITASESETQGLVLTEAMACGTPVVAANALAIPEIVKDGVNGYLFPAGDYEALAEIILKKEFTKSMIKEAYKTANEFSVDSSVSKLEALYNSLIE